MRIGTLARRAGVTRSTIRFYERAGVLPEPARTAAGYRDYDERSLDVLAFVRAGQAVGLTLAELREIVAFRERGEIPCAHVVELLDRHSDQVAARIDQLRGIQRDLRTLAARARRLDPADCRPEGICQVIVDPAKVDAY